MDSLLANYASSDEEEAAAKVDQEEKPSVVSTSAANSLRLPPPKPSSSSSSLFSTSLPPPKSSAASLFSSSLPPPKSSTALPSSSSSLFASLPPPKAPSFDPSPAALKPSQPVSSHAVEVDGVEEEKGGIVKAQSSLFSSLPPPKPFSSSSRPKSTNLGEENGEEGEKGGTFTPGTPSSTPFRAQNSLFSALPPPKDSSSPSLFSFMPPPKSGELDSQKNTHSSSSDRNPKKVVQFKLPLNPSMLKSGVLDDDDDDEDEKDSRSINNSSSGAPKAPSSISAMLPAPKNTIGLVRAAASASSRRSIVDADVTAGSARILSSIQESSALENSGAYEDYSSGFVGASTESGANEAKHMGFPGVSSNVGWDPSAVEGTTYSAYGDSSVAAYWDPSYGGAVNYENFEGNWSEGTAAMTSEVPDMGRIAGKRGRNEIPTEIMEVKQDELMKNRPRQDQTKLTGIAFGPSYQPASSGKGKPSKLHKRKHQIGSLYFDMRQKEMELAERRAKGLLTKAETQAKYGW
ncbi:hypothetical protein Cni_G01379 [Canna indica]|uniref:Proline-rich protein PRCC n=1 Tax=Canna indica TaxID=4628 RepID=A0AAQ3JMI9_9LILI|nr:hypothetical protein Cni_G01379 [Canna indica]